MPGSDGNLAMRIATQVAVLHADAAVRRRLTADLVTLAERYRDAIAAGTDRATSGGTDELARLVGADHDVDALELLEV